MTPRTRFNIVLWLAQIMVGVPFIAFGVMKLTRPIAELAVNLHWAGELPEAFVRFMGAIDLAGGLGLLLPGITRIRPRVTIFAAFGCVLLQICAIVFHVVRGEAVMTPLNVVFLALSAFILWGRRTSDRSSSGA